MADIVVTDRFYKPTSQPVTGGERYLRLYYNKQSGAVRLTEVTSVGAETTVYKDGVWEYNPGTVNTAEEKIKVHELVKSTIETKVFPNLKSSEVKAQFVVQKAPSKDIPGGGQDPVPTKDSTGLAGAARDFLGGIPQLGVITVDEKSFVSKNMATLFPESAIIKYPKDMSEFQDRLSITQYEYKAPYKDAFKTPTEKLFEKGIQRGSALNLKAKLATVILPMPNGTRDNNSVDWGGGDKMSSLQIGAAGNFPVAMGIAGVSEAAGIGNAVANSEAARDILSKSPKWGAALQGALGVLSNPAIKGMAANLMIGGGLNNPIAAAAFQSAILKAAGIEVDPDVILSRGHGVVPNSNLELLFNGPTLREFSFAYRMSPRSEEEAVVVRKIIRYFKQGMAPKKSNASNSNAGGASALLAAPNVFKLRYLSGDKPISGVNKFKICALKNISVSYSPDGQWAAYDKGQPISVTMELRFSELEPIYESDYQEGVVNGLRDDYEPITPDDVGY